MLRTTVWEKVNLTDAMEHAEVSAVGVDDLNVIAVIFVDGLKIVDPVVFKTRS